MARGELEAVWAISDSLLRRGAGLACAHPVDEQWLWDGTPLDGRDVVASSGPC